jgi:hypothetical protein
VQEEPSVLDFLALGGQHPAVCLAGVMAACKRRPRRTPAANDKGPDASGDEWEDAEDGSGA